VISAFSTVIDISPLTTDKHLATVVDDSQAFSPQEVDQIRLELAKQPRYAYMQCVQHTVTTTFQLLDRREETAGHHRPSQTERGGLPQGRVAVAIGRRTQHVELA
jgi:hypothetical protein